MVGVGKGGPGGKVLGGVLVTSVSNLSMSSGNCLHVCGSNAVIMSGLCSSPPF